MSFEGKNLVGVDIGTSAIKVIQVKESGKGIHLLKYGVEPLPPQSIVDGHVMNSGAVVDALKKVFSDGGRTFHFRQLGDHQEAESPAHEAR